MLRRRVLPMRRVQCNQRSHMLKRLLLIAAIAAPGFAQLAFRVDPTPIFTTPGNTPPGASAPMHVVPGSQIALCGNPSCTTTANSFMDGTAAQLCPINAPVTVPGTAFCTATTSATGRFGFWLAPGTYWYMATLPSGQTLGPWPVSVGGGGGGGGGTGTVTSWGVGSLPSVFGYSVASSTTTPQFTMTWANGQQSHQVLGTCGASTTFGPCPLTPAEIPILNQNTTGSAASLTNQYIDWNATAGGSSIANKPTVATIASVTNLIAGNGAGAGVDSGIVPANVLQSGNPTVASWLDFYPPSDSTHYIGILAPPSRSTQLHLQLPSTDPTAGQVMTCGAPSGASPPVSTCTWSANGGGSMVYPVAGIPVSVAGTSWRGTAAAYADIVGLWASGSCTGYLKNDGTCSTSTASATGTIDLSASVSSSGASASLWINGTGTYPIYGGAGGPAWTSFLFTGSGDTARATFRLPFDWNSTTVGVKMATIDVDGNAGGVSYSVAIGCAVSGVQSTLTSNDPTFGTGLTLTGTQGSNLLLEMAGSGLNIPAACTAGTIARVLVTRNSSARAGNHGMLDLALSYVH